MKVLISVFYARTIYLVYLYSGVYKYHKGETKVYSVGLNLKLNFKIYRFINSMKLIQRL